MDRQHGADCGRGTDARHRFSALSTGIADGNFEASLPVLTLAPKNLAGVLEDILLLALLTDSLQQGKLLVENFKHAVDSVHTLTASLSHPRVYCEEWGKPLIHSQAWVAELVEAAGGVFTGIPGSHTTAEAIAAADPDVLLFAWCGAGDRVPLRSVVEKRGWQHLRAVRDGRVYCVPDEFLNTPAHTLLDGLACIAHAFHPSQFAAPPLLVKLLQG